MSVSKMSKDEKRKQVQTHNQILTSVGCLFVVGVSTFSVIGTKSAINRINSDVQDVIVYAQQQVNQSNYMNSIHPIVDSNNDKSDEFNPSSDEVTVVDTYEHNVTSNVDIDSTNSVDFDSHTDMNDESDVVITDNDESDIIISDDDTSSDIIIDFEDNTKKELETNTDLVSGKEWLTQSKNGDYEYVVKCGDRLIDLCDRACYPLCEIVEYNHIENPNLIYIGQVIKFPQAGPNGTADYTNIGL